MEIETAVRKHLLKQNSIKNLVVDRVWKFELEEAIEGTGRAAIVVKRNGSWTAPGYNSQEYPLLVVDMYADDSRPTEGAMADQPNRNERVMQLFREVDRVLHQVDRETRFWPEGDTSGLLVLGCFRGSEPTEPHEEAGVAAVRVTYDLQVIH